MSCCCAIRASVPCPCSVDFAVFLGGITLPIAAFSVFVAGTTPTGVFALPANPAPINTPQDFIAYLNATVIPQLINAGHTVQGVFSLAANKILVPVVDGGCLIASIQRVPSL